MRPVPCLPLLAVALACRTGDTSVLARMAIDASDARWTHLTSVGHADSLAEFYHPNAVLYPPNMAPVRGRDSIRAFFAVLNTMSSPPPTLAIRAESIWAVGPSAVELGRWSFTWPAGAKHPPGVAAVDSGKYIVRWVNENDRWLMAQDIWNSDVAMPMPHQ
jgi:ketosteroid isomerase-like protein